MLKKQIRRALEYFLRKTNRRLIRDAQGQYRLERNVFFDEFALYRKYFRTTDPLVIFDVGAFDGDTAAEFRNAFPKAKIHCFEPAPDNFEKLTARFDTTESLYLNQAAVGAGQSELELFVLGNNASGNSLVKPSNQNLIHKTIKVPVLCLDQYCTDKNITRIDILKIDTQGFERECLEGLLQMLSASHIGLIKLEVMFHETYVRRTSFRLLEDILHEYGYYLLDICWIKKSSHEKRTLVVDVIYGKISADATVAA